jgi:TetR/AcrR family transcriptional regulator, regulator of autoinduction and epiphytic fitness
VSTSKACPAPACRRGDAKRAAVVDAATCAFLSRGYELTSMDAIAAEAGVSKRTVYNHFPCKQVLFRAVVRRIYGEMLDSDSSLPSPNLPPETALPQLARTLLAHLRRPEVTDLLRLMIAEQRRFPELATEFHDEGKGPALSLVTRYLTTANAQGWLRIADPLRGARQFLGTLKENLFWPSLFGLPVTEDDDSVIADTTAMMLRLYGPDAPPLPPNKE